VLHLHELLKVRSNATKLYSRLARRFEYGSLDNNQNQLRPHIVWFEEVPAEEAIILTETADYFAVIELPQYILRQG
jgi:NAD-dependent deacetylase